MPSDFNNPVARPTYPLPTIPILKLIKKIMFYFLKFINKKTPPKRGLMFVGLG